MATEKYTTLGESTLSSGVDDSTVTWPITSVASFPTAGNFRIRADDEIVKVTGVSGSDVTVVRGQEGTAAASHSGGATVTEVLTAAALDGIRADISSIGVIASLPATTGQTAGNQYHTTDGFYRYVFNGSIWKPFYGSLAVTEPVSGDFAWINQGSATIDTSYGGVILAAPASGTTSQRIRKKSAPATPYTIVIMFKASMNTGNFAGVGFVWRQSSDGKLVSVHATQNELIQVDKWTDATTFSSTATSAAYPWMRDLIVLKLQDNGTNRIVSVSQDYGKTFEVLFSEGRTTFLTADEVGYSANSVSATQTPSIALLHWAES